MVFGGGQKGAVLGVDVGSKVTKVVQFKFTGKGGPELAVCESLDTGLNDESFVASFGAFLNDAKLKNSLAALSFDDESMVIRKFELPKMPHDELVEAIRWNYRDHIDEDLSLYNIDYSTIDVPNQEEGGLLHYLAYAVKRQAVQDFQLKMGQVGLTPFMLEPRDVTLASSLDRVIPDEEHFRAGVDVGYNTSKFYVIGRRTFAFTRYMPLVNYRFFEESPDEFRKKLAIEIQKSIDTFQVNFQMESVRSIHISGAGALVPDITDYLAKNLGLETISLNPFVNLHGAENFSEVKPELFAQAVSLAFLQP